MSSDVVEVRVEYRAKHPAGEADRVKKIIKEHIRKGRDALGFSLSPAITILGGIERFLKYQRSYKNNCVATRRTHEARLRWWADALGRGAGDVAVDCIQLADVDDSVDSLRDRLSPGTANKYLSSLKAFGKWTISRNLAGGSSLPWLTVDRCEATPPARTALSVREFELLMKRWPQSGRHVARVVWMLIFGGARPAALRTLTWRKVRYDAKRGEGRIPLRRLKGGTLELITFTAGSAIRRVLDDARADFTEFYGRAPTKSDPVFVPMPRRGRQDGQGIGWATASALSHAVAHHARRAAESCQDDLSKEFVAYLARHSVLTWLAKENVCDELRARFAGHTNTRQQQTYMHLSGEDAREVREFIDCRLGRLYDTTIGFASGEDAQVDDVDFGGLMGLPEFSDPACPDLQLQPLAMYDG